MTDTGEFINDFLEHGLSREDIKRYNREYYLRTRKLAGRKANGVKKDVLYVKDVIERPGHHALKKFDAWDKKNRAAYSKRMDAQERKEILRLDAQYRKERLEKQKLRLEIARAKAKKIKDAEKKKSVLRKIWDLDRKLTNKAKKKLVDEIEQPQKPKLDKITIGKGTNGEWSYPVVRAKKRFAFDDIERNEQKVEQFKINQMPASRKKNAAQIMLNAKIKRIEEGSARFEARQRWKSQPKKKKKS